MENLGDPHNNATAIPSLPLPTSAPPPVRAMLHISMSPRPPTSALLSPSPRLLAAATVEPLTPDWGQQAVPYCSADDVKDLALPGSNANNVISSASAPRMLPRPVNEINVVDEEHADRIFRAVSRRHSEQFNFTLPSPKELTGGHFSGSSNLPTPKLSQSHCDQLQQREITSPPALFQANISMAPLLFSSHTPPIPGSFPVPLPEPVQPQTPDDLHKLRPLHTHFFGAPWQNAHVARMFEDRSNLSSSTLTASVDIHPMSSTDNDSESSLGSKPQQCLWSDMNPEIGSERVGREKPPAHVIPKASNMKPKTVPLKCNGEQPQCDLCGAHFARRSNLYKHKRSVHVEHRQFKCDICNYGFKRQDHLVKHKKCVHNKERNFPCEICGTAFAEKYNLKKHLRVIHFTQRPFKCGCGAYFQHKDQMLDCLRCKR